MYTYEFTLVPKGDDKEMLPFTVVVNAYNLYDATVEAKTIAGKNMLIGDMTNAKKIARCLTVKDVRILDGPISIYQ